MRKTTSRDGTSIAFDRLGNGPAPTEQAASVTAPRLVIAGEVSFPFMHATAQALAAALPNGHAFILEGQTHDVAPQVLAPVLEDFFLG